MPQTSSSTLTLNETDPLSELEAAMRRALGAMGPSRSRPSSGQRAGTQASFTPRRPNRFVRDGEVLVEHVTAPRSRGAHAGPTSAQAARESRHAEAVSLFRGTGGL